MAIAAQTKPRKSGWSPERRAKQSASIKRWHPWSKSTGPRTAAGKARAAQNAAKPWLKHDPGRKLEEALRAHTRYLADINRYLALQKNGFKNELLKKHLKNLRRALYRKGRKVTIQLHHALLYAKLCKNLAFLAPFPLKINANSSHRLGTPKAGMMAMELK